MGESARDARITRLGDVLARWAIEEALDVEDFPADEPVSAELGFGPQDVDALLALREASLACALALD